MLIGLESLRLGLLLQPVRVLTVAPASGLFLQEQRPATTGAVSYSGVRSADMLDSAYCHVYTL